MAAWGDSDGWRTSALKRSNPWHDGTPHSAKQDLAEARRLIEKHGYWRRKGELEDAERFILHGAR